MMAIPLGKQGQYECRVSDEDYAALTRWRWNYKFSDRRHGRGIYARRGGGKNRDGSIRPTVLMHVYILETLMGEARPSELHTVDHIDGDTLNNTRENLRWATKREQNRNRRRRKPKIVEAPPIAPRSGYVETFGDAYSDPLAEDVAA